MSCPSEEVLVAFSEGALDGAELSSVSRHLRSCGDCRRVLASLSPAGESVGPLLGHGGGPVLPEGTAVGRYLLRRFVGAGGMGRVYEAEDPLLHRAIAVKLLAGELARGADGLMLGEGRALARLSHPNVVQVHDVGLHEGAVFIAMEWIDGAPLSAWAQTQRPWREVLRVFQHAGEGLAAAHAAGIVHRDFKPANVLLGQDGRARVTDFGLAHLVFAGEKSATGGIRPSSGTPAYMAPEQLEGAGATPLTDQYSFCASLYEALHSFRPGAQTQFVDFPVGFTERWSAVWRCGPSGVTPTCASCWMPWLRIRHQGGDGWPRSHW